MIKLRHYQEEDLVRIFNFRGRALVANEQGTGKTAESLAWIQKIPSRRPVLIVAPSSVKYAWQHEALTSFGIRARVLEGQGPKRSEHLRLEDDILIINYDILHFWLKVLKRNPPKVLIIDECQYCSNPRARRTKAVKAVSWKAESILGLSGTPMTNRPIQLWAILNIIRPDIFPSFHDFAWMFCEPKHTHWGWKYDGAVKKKELWGILTKHVMIRRLKKEVAPELPDKIHKIIPMKMGPAATKEYEKARESFLAWLKEKSPAKASRAARAEAMVKAGYLLRLCARLKMSQVVNFIKEFKEINPGKKIVGLTGNTFVIDRLKEEFPDCVVVDGRVTGRHRTESVRRFRESTRINDFWGNWRAAGVGLNLQKAHNFIALDPPDSPGLFLQGIDRVHRLGQDSQVIIHRPVLMGTMEEKRWKKIEEKSKVLSEIIDGHAESSGPKANIFDELLKELS
jgi:SWI/SNF-related matrix-associated actin-dependent regulator 1 of chromatin subfamily A